MHVHFKWIKDFDISLDSLGCNEENIDIFLHDVEAILKDKMLLTKQLEANISKWDYIKLNLHLNGNKD